MPSTALKWSLAPLFQARTRDKQRIISGAGLHLQEETQWPKARRAPFCLWPVDLEFNPASLVLFLIFVVIDVEVALAPPIGSVKTSPHAAGPRIS